MAEPSSAGTTPLERILNGIDRVFRYLLVVMFAAVLVAALVQVGARYVFHVTIIGPEEVARYLMIACTFLAIPVLAKSRNQIAVDALAHYVPNGTPQVWLARTVLIIEALFLVVFGYFAWEFTDGLLGTGQATVGLGMPLSWPALTMVTGAGLGLVVTLALLVRTFTAAGERDPYGLGQQEHFGVPGETS